MVLGELLRVVVEARSRDLATYSRLRRQVVVFVELEGFGQALRRFVSQPSGLDFCAFLAGRFADDPKKDDPLTYVEDSRRVIGGIDDRVEIVWVVGRGVGRQRERVMMLVIARLASGMQLEWGFPVGRKRRIRMGRERASTALFTGSRHEKQVNLSDTMGVKSFGAHGAFSDTGSIAGRWVRFSEPVAGRIVRVPTIPRAVGRQLSSVRFAERRSLVDTKVTHIYSAPRIPPLLLEKRKAICDG